MSPTLLAPRFRLQFDSFAGAVWALQSSTASSRNGRSPPQRTYDFERQTYGSIQDAANPERCSAGDRAIYFAGLPHEDATQKPERSSDCARAPEAPPATTTPRSRPNDPCDS